MLPSVVLAPPGPKAHNGTMKNQEPLRHFLFYTLSLPERALRSTVGLAAGAVKEMSEFLVPKAFQDSKTYKIVVRNSLSFLLDKVAGLELEEEENEQTVSDDFLARKAVGNFLDLTSLATMHVSPVWLLAIVSDLAYGTHTYIQELAQELEEKGIIAESSTIRNVDDFLEAVAEGAGRAASLVDTPPLSVEQLKQSAEETKEALARVDVTQLLPAKEIQETWDEMRRVADASKLGLLDVSAAMTMNAFDKLGAVIDGTFSGLVVATGLLDRVIIDHYKDALERIAEKGLFAIVKESYEPYVEAVFKNFSGDRETLTEKVLDGTLLVRFLRWCKNLFARKKPPHRVPSCPDEHSRP